MILPIRFNALYQERVWGGRSLEEIYNRQLPKADVPYGESWEVTDRQDEQSVVVGGEYDGCTLNQLWRENRDEVFGSGLQGERFPLLIKILDCRDDLSIQVHPPAELADELQGEPKTEMWYIADADPGAKLYVGLKQGVTRESFEQSLADGTVADQVHAISARSGESIFIPSGRLHAIGAGFLIYEIQQNSDTTYRVFDWNRRGLDGKPRELHVEQSLRCIDFNDFEPSMDEPMGPNKSCISDCEYFYIDKLSISGGGALGNPDPERFSIVTVVSGVMEDEAGERYQAGDFVLMPKGASPLKAVKEAVILQTVIPREPQSA